MYVRMNFERWSGLGVHAPQENSSTAAIAAFGRALGDAGVIVDRAGMARYLRDWSGDHHGNAAAILRPGSSKEVSTVVELCRSHGLAVVPQGGNTGLVAGGIDIATRRRRASGTAVDGAAAASVVINLERMNRIQSLDVDNFAIRVEAGCTLQQVKDAAERAGCLFPLALGAQGSCQIGGNVATNAGGVNVVRYGMMRDLVLGLEAVLPDGEIWNGLSGLRKDNRGYDLKQLFIGSEGTLGIVTSVELKLFPRPDKVETAWLALSSFDDAMRLFGAARHWLADLVTAFEVIGEECLPLARAIDPALAIPVEAPVHVLIEASCSGAIEPRPLFEDFLAEELESGSIGDCVLATSGAQAKGFWAIREGLVEGQARRGFHVRTDLSVPLSGVAGLVTVARGLIAQKFPNWTALAYGHAGDGNIHFNVLPPAGMAAAEARATGAEIEKALYALALAQGGSFSAEHGIGRSRSGTFWSALPPAQRRLLEAVKRAFDPDGIMNPGCLFPNTEDAR
jgi:FAD/FMN-containing dehydrogenase